MTWEIPDRNWWRLVLPSFVLGLIALVLLIKFLEGGKPTLASYQSSCEEQNGEWLERATKPTCVFPGGKLVVFGDPQDTHAPSPISSVIASDDSMVPSTDPAPECGYGKLGEFADYPATDTYRGRPHKPDFSTWPAAALYRTAISKDVSRGINFGGAYVLARWGMPSDDAQPEEGFAIVDAKSGRIITYWTNIYSVDFNKTSRFFRIHSSTGVFAEIISNGQEVRCGKY